MVKMVTKLVTPMRPQILSFEKVIGVTPHGAALLLGISYSTWTKYRSDVRPIPRDVNYHMEALQLLPARQRAKLVRERLDV